MTTDNSTNTDIDTLAERAKEMLERVRGSADPDALTTTQTPIEPTNDGLEDPATEATQEVFVEEEFVAHEDVAVEETFEETVVEDAVVEEATVEEDTVVEQTEVFEDTTVDEVVIEEDVFAEEGDNDLEDATVTWEEDRVEEEIFQEVEHEPVADLEPSERAGAVFDLGSDQIDEIDADGAGHDAEETLNLFGRDDEREVDDFEYSFGSNRDALAVDPSEGVFDGVDEVEVSADAHGIGYLGDADVDDAPAISTDDLIAEIESLSDDDPVANVVGLDDEIDTPIADGSFDDLDYPEADSIEIEHDDPAFADESRKRGRLSDLGAETPPPQPTKGRFSRRPHVDHDLNELFIKPGAPDQAVPTRSSSWLVPIVCLAIAILAFAWWAAGRNGSDSDPVNADGDAGAADTGSEVTDITEDAAATASTASTATTEAVTATSEASPETFETAWDLMSEASSTSDFAELAGPLGLQQVLEQQVTADGEPVRFTLLAPSNAAIAKLTPEQLDLLATDADAARGLVDYHFIDQALTPEFLLQDSGGQIMTRAGVPILVDYVDDEIVFNGEARIELAGLDAANGSVLVIDSVLSPPSINTIVDLGIIQFKPIQSVLTDEGKTELQKAVNYFNENPDATAIIEGHTDTDGEEANNLNLSQRRADAVRAFLIEQGIDAGRLEAKGFGETQPVIVDGAEDKDASRRIEFILQ